MKNITLILAVMMIASLGVAQESDTNAAPYNLTTTTLQGFGGPLIRATQVNSDWGILIGGKGGVIINKKFAFGGFGMGLAGISKFSGDNLNGNENASLNLGFGGGGVFAEYIHKLDKTIHFSIPIHMMAGGVSVTEEEIEIESSLMLAFEPGINVEFNVAKNFITGIHFSYRQAFSTSLVNASNQDLSGVVLGLVFKFGNFGQY